METPTLPHRLPVIPSLTENWSHALWRRELREKRATQDKQQQWSWRCAKLWHFRRQSWKVQWPSLPDHTYTILFIWDTPSGTQKLPRKGHFVSLCVVRFQHHSGGVLRPVQTHNTANRKLWSKNIWQSPKPAQLPGVWPVVINAFIFRLWLFSSLCIRKAQVCSFNCRQF